MKVLGSIPKLAFFFFFFESGNKMERQNKNNMLFDFCSIDTQREGGTLEREPMRVGSAASPTKRAKSTTASASAVERRKQLCEIHMAHAAHAARTTRIRHAVFVFA